jgi:hypothetical protein
MVVAVVDVMMVRNSVGASARVLSSASAHVEKLRECTNATLYKKVNLSMKDIDYRIYDFECKNVVEIVDFGCSDGFGCAFLKPLRLGLSGAHPLLKNVAEYTIETLPYSDIIYTLCDFKF